MVVVVVVVVVVVKVVVVMEVVVVEVVVVEVVVEEEPALLKSTFAQLSDLRNSCRCLSSTPLPFNNTFPNSNGTSCATP